MGPAAVFAIRDEGKSLGLPAARIGDMHVCPMVTGLVPHVGGPVDTGCMTVIVGGMPAARVGDLLVCVGPPDVIATGATHVFIGGMLAARITDSTVHGGKIVMGCPTVMIEPGPNDDDSDPDDDDEDDGEDGDGEDDGDGDGDSDSQTRDGDSDNSNVEGQSGQAGDGAQDGGAPGGQGGGDSGGEGQGDGAGGAGSDGGDATIRDGPINSNPTTLSAGLEADVGTPPPSVDLGAATGQALSGAAQGAWEGAVDAVKGVVDLGRGAYQLATSQQARNDAYNNFQAFQGAAGKALQDPGGTTRLAGQAVQNAASAFLQSRQAAYDAGKGAEFDGKLFGRAAFEVGSNLVPGAALHRLGNIARGAKAAGVSLPAAYKLRAIAEEYNVVIEMRPTNPAARALIAKGHPPKPALLKGKTFTDIDKEIGAPPKAKVGELVHFEPQQPSLDLQQRNPTRYAQAKARYEQRLTEYKELSGDMERYVRDGHIRIEDGVVKQGATGKSFTGDNDVFGIHGADGRQLTQAEKDQIIDRLKSGPVQVQHGAHLDWDTSKEFDPAKAEKMKQAIIRDHMAPEDGGGGKKLAAFGPRGYQGVYARPQPVGASR